MKYKKKPVEIEAVQWDGDNWVDVSELIKDVPPMMQRVMWRNEHIPNCLMIRTLEGELTARPGDYIIKGVKGELYPCKPDIFEQTYERVEE